jgi:hypothetical protein
MISRCLNRMCLRAVAPPACFVVAAAPTMSQEPGANPFDGEWSLTFDVNTPPGGVTLTNEYGSDSPFHLVFHASKRSFRPGGTFTKAKRGRLVADQQHL